MLRAHLRAGPWWVEQASLRGGRDVLICTSVLTDGLTELHLGSLVRSAGLQVAGVLAGVEFTTRGARGRLEMLGARVDSLVRVADTPRGVEFERRGEKVE